MTAPATTIRRADKAARRTGFERLLNSGLEQLRQISGQRWSDHNLHDPGITVLEQLCFALTELGFHADFPVADHLTGPDERIHFEALALHPPSQALSCRPTTPADYRRVLLDQVDGLSDADLRRAGHGPAGVYRLLLRHAGTEPGPRRAQQQAAWRAYLGQRNLCEDAEHQPQAVKDRVCELHADIEITGTRDAAELMAEIYHEAARWIDRQPRWRSRRELQQRGRSLDQIHDGPLTAKGFSDDEAHDDHDGLTLYLADLAAHLATLTGVRQIHHLALQTGEQHHTGSLKWRQGDTALRLKLPGEGGDAQDRVGVQLRRRQHRQAVGAEALWRRVQNLQATERSQARQRSAYLREEEAAALPRGQWRAPSPYQSVQHHFPPLYGLGLQPLPSSATRQDAARVQQMRAYLMMFDQLLANGEAQVAHLRELFAVPEAGHQSYWFAALGEDPRAVPGAAELLGVAPGELAGRLRAHFDRSNMRKSRLLDHLLALHGETFSQNALRPYCGHLRSDELDELLLHNKCRYLQHIVELGRDRAGSFDYSRDLWDPSPEGASQGIGLVRRVCALLGFRHDHARPLAGALLEAGLAPSPPGPGSVAALDRREADEGLAIDVVDVDPAAATRALREPAAYLAQRLAGPNTALLRAGAHHGRYRLRQRRLPEGPDGAARSYVEVLVGPDENQRWWPLGRAADTPTARAAAASMRRQFLAFNDAAEGLHVLEHVLLRPLQPDSPAHARLGLDDDFYGLRLSVVMPGWSVRTHQPQFRNLVEETLRLNVPAHIDLMPVRWLEFQALQDFEQDFGRWLQCRRAWCADPSILAAQRAVDDAAATLIGWLRPGPAAPADDEMGDG